MQLSKMSLALLLATEKGYYIQDGEAYNKKSEKLKSHITHGYKTFSIKLSKSRKTCFVPIHRLVAFQKFGEKIFDSKICVRHLDGNPLNNLEKNIEIGSHQENSFDRSALDRSLSALRASYRVRKLSEDQVRLIHQDLDSGLSHCETRKKWGIAKSSWHYLVKSIYFQYPKLEDAIEFIKSKHSA